MEYRYYLYLTYYNFQISRNYEEYTIYYDDAADEDCFEVIFAYMTRTNNRKLFFSTFANLCVKCYNIEQKYSISYTLYTNQLAINLFKLIETFTGLSKNIENNK